MCTFFNKVLLKSIIYVIKVHIDTSKLCTSRNSVYAKMSRLIEFRFTLGNLSFYTDPNDLFVVCVKYVWYNCYNASHNFPTVRVFGYTLYQNNSSPFGLLERMFFLLMSIISCWWFRNNVGTRVRLWECFIAFSAF